MSLEPYFNPLKKIFFFLLPTIVNFILYPKVIWAVPTCNISPSQDTALGTIAAPPRPTRKESITLKISSTPELDDDKDYKLVIPVERGLDKDILPIRPDADGVISLTINDDGNISYKKGDNEVTEPAPHIVEEFKKPGVVKLRIESGRLSTPLCLGEFFVLQTPTSSTTCSITDISPSQVLENFPFTITIKNAQPTNKLTLHFIPTVDYHHNPIKEFTPPEDQYDASRELLIAEIKADLLLPGEYVINITDTDNTLCLKNYSLTVHSTTPPTLTPLPPSNENIIRCDSGGEVTTSVPHEPHGFPEGTTEVTFTFPVSQDGLYRMRADAGFGPDWEEYPEQQLSRGDKYIITLTNKRTQKYFDKDTDFHLQRFESGSWKAVPDYTNCRWRVQKQSRCLMSISVQDIPGIQDQADVIFDIRNVPFTREDFAGGYLTLSPHFSLKNLISNEIVYFEKITKVDALITVKNVDRYYYSNGEKKFITYQVFLEHLLLDAGGIKKTWPIEECPVKEIILSEYGSINPQPTIIDSSPLTESIPLVKSHQVCKPLCGQIKNGTLRDQCRTAGWNIDLPDPPFIKIPVWQLPQPGIPFWDEDPLERLYEQRLLRAIDNMLKNEKEENLEVLKCIRCVTTSGAYTAFGCIPTEPTGFIQRVFSIAIPLMAGILFLGFIYTGFLAITSTGEPEKLQHTKDVAKSLILGSLLVLFSVFLYALIGGTILGVPGFEKPLTPQECSQKGIKSGLSYATCKDTCNPTSEAQIGQCIGNQFCCARW